MNNKILVINPPHRMFPLGMAYVLASLEKHGIDYDFTDAQFGDDYKGLIRKNDYYAVATGGLISHYAFFNEVSRYAHEIRPHIPVIFGGGITKDMPPSLLFDKLDMTYGIIGEAEMSFPFLVDALLHKNAGFESIPGLLYKDPQTGEIIRNPVRYLDLATTDILPAWHRFDVDYYINDWEHVMFGSRSCMPVISARGCTGTCTFCSPPVGVYRKRPVDQVIREIELLNEQYVFDWIGFFNEMFYATREEIVDFCESYRSVTHRKAWICDLRVDMDFDIDTFRLMKSVGCAAVFVGLESGSKKILSLMKKRTTPEMITRFFRTAEDAGLPCVGTFLVGNEGETEVDLKETVDMVTRERMRTNGALVCTYPGTKIYSNAKKRGLISDEWEYLQRLNFLAEIWDYTWSKKDYLNISAIPDDRFLEVVVGELRRFHTYNLMHFTPGNMDWSKRFGILMKVSGVCAACGSSVTFVTPKRMLGIQTYCRNCFRTVEFNLFDMKEYHGHYQWLGTELRKARTLAIAGVKDEAISFLKYDYFQFNYQSLIGFFNVDKKTSGISDFCHLPVFQIEALPSRKLDTILIVDDLFGDTEFKIRKVYLKENLQLPRLLHVFPDKDRSFIRVLRFVRKHTSTSTGSKCLVVPAIHLPIFVADMQGWCWKMIKSFYHMLIRHEFFQVLLKKVGLR